MTVDTSRIVLLARQILYTVSQIDQSLADKNLPRPTFEESSPRMRVPPDLTDLQDIVLDATSELHDLFLEPLILVKKYAAPNYAICIQAIGRYDLASKVPFNGRASFAELGSKTTLGEQMTRRLLRHAMTMRIFYEPEPGFVAHTQASKLLADPVARAWVRVGTDVLWTPSTMMLDALEKWPESQEANETAFSYSINSSQSFYEYVSSDLERSDLFSKCMSLFASQEEYSHSHITGALDWESLVKVASAKGLLNDKGCVEIVDVGGSHGEAAGALVQKFHGLDITVQDQGTVIETAVAAIPEHIKSTDRVKFMAHDLFAPQTITADVYIFRWIFHNWSDKNCIAILRAQIPALRTGSRILVMESCMPDPGQSDPVGVLPVWLERESRAFDMQMAAAFNARERTIREWRHLFAEADPRLKLEGVRRPKGSALSMLEVVWTGGNGNDQLVV